MTIIEEKDAVDHLIELLDRVAHGEKIMIEKAGVAVAVLTPAEMPAENKRSEIAQLITEFKEFTKDIRLDGLSIREMIEDGQH